MTDKPNKVGRPSKKDTISLESLTLLCERGFTDKEIAQIYGVSIVTIHNYKSDPKFLSTLKEGKELADYLVKKSLYKRALGFEYDEVTYEKSKTGGLALGVTKKEDKDAEITSLKHTPTHKIKVVTKLIIPDVTAQIFWLKNRQPEDWRDKHEVEHKVDLDLKGLLGTDNQKD